MDRRHFLAGVATTVASGSLARVANSKAALDMQATGLELQRVMDAYVSSGRLSGAVAAVTIAGAAPAYIRSGRISLDHADSFDENSVCRIYSMTKPVTGCAAMLLIEDGHLRLDQPLADILPEFRNLTVATDASKGLAARPATRTLTIRHLLTHSGGLAYWTPEAGTDALSKAYRAQGITPGNFYKSGLSRPGYGPQANSLDDMVRRLATLPLASEPGAAWRYSVGLDVMGLVIERVSGQPLDVFTRERLFTPLGMDSTGFRVPSAAAARLTSNYTVTPTGLAPLDPGETSVFLQPPPLLGGGAGLVSTARDFTRFGAMLSGDGRLGKVSVMEPATARVARSNLLPANVSYQGGGFGAGMSVGAGGPSPRDAIGAVSWNGAAGTMWLVDPARGLNFVFLSQFTPPTSYPIWEEIMSALSSSRHTVRS